MTTTSMSLAKTTQPVLTAVVERSRLNLRLDEARHSAAAWLTAPAGAGKTTAAAAWVGQAKLPVLWFQLDPVDSDPGSFCHYLRLTAMKHAPAGSTALPEVAATADWPAFARRLIREIFARYRHGLNIVFDCYESLPLASPMHAVLAELLHEVPANGFILFLSRAAPPATFARACTHGSLRLLDGDELKFASAESMALASLRGVNLTERALADILQAAAGWAAGTLLLLEQHRRTSHHARAQHGEILFNYVAAEVFATFEPEVQSFLLQVCWPRHLTPALANNLSQEPRAVQMLAHLARNNYFVTERADGAACEYTLHPLLREFLIQRATEQLGEPVVRQRLISCARLLVDAGSLEEGVDMLVDQMAWEDLTTILLDAAPLLLNQGRSELLISWLEQLPAESLQRNGWLACWYGQARLPSAPRQARRDFETAWRLLDGNDDDGAALAIAGICQAVLNEGDDFSVLDPWLARADALQPAQFAPPAALAIARALAPAYAIRAPATQGYFIWLEQLRPLTLRPSATHQAIDDIATVALCHLLTGAITQAGTTLARIPVPAADSVAGNPALSRQALATVQAFVAGNHSALKDFCACRTTTATVPPAATTIADAMLALLEGHPRAAVERLLENVDAPPVASRLAAYSQLLLSALAAQRNGDPLNAHRHLRLALDSAAELGVPALEVLARTVYAQVLFDCADERACTAQLRRVHALARDLANPWLEYLALLTYAEIALTHGRDASAMNALRYALGLGRQHDFTPLPWWDGTRLANLLVRALREEIEPMYVRDAIARGNLLPQPAPLDLADWPWPVRFRLLGGIALEHYPDYRPATTPHRPLQVLAVIIALDRQQVRFGDVAAALWPHVDSDYAEKSLTINLHRLRKLLGGDNTVLLQDGLLSLNDSIVWTDVAALQTILQQVTAERVARGTANGWQRATLERLTALYRGPFAGQQNDMPGFVAMRDQLRRQLEQAVSTIHASAADAAALQPALAGLRAVDPELSLPID